MPFVRSLAACFVHANVGARYRDPFRSHRDGLCIARGAHPTARSHGKQVQASDALDRTDFAAKRTITGPDARLAQWESITLTLWGSQVQSLHRAPSKSPDSIRVFSFQRGTRKAAHKDLFSARVPSWKISVRGTRLQAKRDAIRIRVGGDAPRAGGGRDH